MLVFGVAVFLLSLRGSLFFCCRCGAFFRWFLLPRGVSALLVALVSRRQGGAFFAVGKVRARFAILLSPRGALLFAAVVAGRGRAHSLTHPLAGHVLLLWHVGARPEGRLFCWDPGALPQSLVGPCYSCCLARGGAFVTHSLAGRCLSCCSLCGVTLSPNSPRPCTEPESQALHRHRQP